MRIDLTPPAPRPVPDEVRRRLRAAVRRGISSDNLAERPGPRGSVVWVMAAAVVTVVAILAVVSIALRPEPLRSTDPAPPVGWAAPTTGNLGLSPAETDSIIDQCFSGAAEGNGGAVSRNDVVLYNLFDDQYGRVAFVAGPRIAIACQAELGAQTYRSAGSATPEGMPAWMVRPVTIDVLAGGPAGGDSGPWAETVAGRVVSAAATVTFSAFGESISLPVVNGTYVGRIVFLHQSEHPANYTVTARDAAGKVLDILAVGQGPICAITPEGVLLGDDWGRDCPPAVVWQ